MAKPRLRRGLIMKYVGDDHPALKGAKVELVAPIKSGWWEIVPWIPSLSRFSWISSDARREDLVPLDEEKDA